LDAIDEVDVSHAVRPDTRVLRRLAGAALAEDVADGDITTDLVVPAGVRTSAILVARAPGVICGLPLARAVFEALDPSLDVTLLADDGDRVERGTSLAAIRGEARPILTAERVALNFVGRLSGIATLTGEYVRAVAGTGVRIVDTRKTTPGLRAVEKYAVRCGGGDNHRVSLSDGFMLKDNHRAALKRAGVPVAEAVAGARRRLGHGVFVTVEADTLDEVVEALDAGADGILLDNMAPDELARAVERVAGAALTEASGGITLGNVRAAAESGVDIISVGALTHSAPALDVALELDWD
jgi:nicotinate-nucleotide pyrophosphorylase (carboxylating)